MNKTTLNWRERVALTQQKHEKEMKTLSWRLRHPVKTIKRTKRKFANWLDDLLD